MENHRADSNSTTVLITGATSGIGRATGKLLATQGFRVFGTGRNPSRDRLEGCHLLQLEVTSDNSVTSCVHEVLDRTGGHIDVLVNNVGTGILGAAEESSAEQVRQLFDINFFGMVRMTNAVLPKMREQRRGLIILLSSAGGIASMPFGSYYCATKHAIEAYGEALRMELQEFQIHVAIVAPGTVSTLAGDKAMVPDRPIEEYQPARDKTTDDYVQGIHKGMDPDRVAKAILRICRSRKPKPRYRVGIQSGLASAMKSWLPSRVFESLTSQAIRDK